MPPLRRDDAIHAHQEDSRMTRAPNVAVIVGSLRRESYNRRMALVQPEPTSAARSRCSMPRGASPTRARAASCRSFWRPLRRGWRCIARRRCDGRPLPGSQVRHCWPEPAGPVQCCHPELAGRTGSCHPQLSGSAQCCHPLGTSVGRPERSEGSGYRNAKAIHSPVECASRRPCGPRGRPRTAARRCWSLASARQVSKD